MTITLLSDQDTGFENKARVRKLSHYQIEYNDSGNDHKGEQCHIAAFFTFSGHMIQLHLLFSIDWTVRNNNIPATLR